MLTIHGARGNSSAFPERKVALWIFNVQKIGKGQENSQIKGDRLVFCMAFHVTLSGVCGFSSVACGTCVSWDAIYQLS